MLTWAKMAAQRVTSCMITSSSPPPYIPFFCPESTLLEVEVFKPGGLKTMGHFPLRYSAVFILKSPWEGTKNLQWAASHVGAHVGVLLKVSQLEGSRIWTLVLWAPKHHVSLSCSVLTALAATLYPLRQGAWPSQQYFPIWANHMPTQCINIFFMSKIVFPQ